MNFLFCLVVLPSEDPKFPPYLTCDRVSYCVETSPPSGLPPWDRRTHREILCFHFCLYLFCTYSEEINLPFWMSGSSDSVQWELFHTHMIFWYFCRGEGGLSVLFLPHLEATSWPLASFVDTFPILTSVILPWFALGKNILSSPIGSFHLLFLQPALFSLVG